MDTSAGHLWALILGGGDGTRLQGLTRLITGAPIPKQYCRILGDRSLLEATLARVAPLVPAARTIAIVNHAHLPLARPQLAGLPSTNVLVQPQNLDTGPGILLSLLHLARCDPDATVAVFPSDHDVRAEAVFRRNVVRMVRVVAARPEKIALLGALPDRPDTGFGYIMPGRRVGGAFEVAAFHEKPARSRAAQIVRCGGLWNSFVMVGRVARMIELIESVRPDDVARLRDADALDVAYRQTAPWNFSRDFLQHVSRHLVVMRAEDFGWSDWGTPEAIERTFATLGLVPPWRMARPVHVA